VSAVARNDRGKDLRQVIVHYHIFKNAGSTLDSMLGKTFGKHWASHDKDQAGAVISPQELGVYIEQRPELLAISSHQAVLPLPEVPGTEIIPVMFLRHPLDRVRSVYDFERRQGLMSGPVSKGAEHASRMSFAEYLRWRLDSTRNGVVHNFQTARMIFERRLNRRALKDADFELAWERVQVLPFFGLVERFDASVVMLSDVLGRRGISFATNYVPHNQSKREESLEDRVLSMRTELGEAMWSELLARNACDMQLYERAQREFEARMQALRRV
jgi:hypothetical protein